jgi:hypothetical protein
MFQLGKFTLTSSDRLNSGFKSKIRHAAAVSPVGHDGSADPV